MQCEPRPPFLQTRITQARLLPAHAQSEAATNTHNGEGGRIAGTRKNDDMALSKKASKDTMASRHESVKNSSSGQEVETVKTEKSEPALY